MQTQCWVTPRPEGRLPLARTHYADAMRISDVSEAVVAIPLAGYMIAIGYYLEVRPDVALEGLALWQRSGSTAFLEAASATLLADLCRYGQG